MILVLCFGACVGSFLNVVIVRTPRGRSVVFPSSRTYPWRSSIPWFQNLPIFSYVVQGGRDVKSGLKYSPRYLVIEVLTAVLFLAIYRVHGWSSQTLIYMIFFGALIASSFIDLELRIIPNSLTLGAWAVTLIFALFQARGFPLSFEMALVSGISFYLLFWFVSRFYYWLTGEEGLGGGDVKFVGFIGSVVGLQGSIVVLLVASFVGAAAALLMMLLYRKTKKYPIPFGPFLALGAMVYILFPASTSWLGVFG